MADTIAEVVVQLEADLADAQKQLSDAGDAAKELGDAIESTGGQFSLFDDAVNKALSAPEQLALFTEALEPIAVVASDAASSMDEVADAGFNLSDALSSLFDRLTEVEEEEERETEVGEKMKEVLMETAQELLGITFAIEGMKEAIVEGFEAFANVERAVESFTALTGSAEVAEESVKKLKELALEEGLKFPALLTAQQRMLALKIPLEAIPELLKATADAAAANKQPFESMANMMERIVGQGMISPRILMRMSLTVADLGHAMGIASGQVREAFRNMDVDERTKVMEAALSRFKGLGEKVAQDLTGSWQNFKTEMEFSLEAIAEKLAPVAREFLKFANETIKDLQHAIEGVDFSKFNADIKAIGQAVVSVVKDLLDLVKLLQGLPDIVKVILVALAAVIAAHPEIAVALALFKLAAAAQELQELDEQNAKTSEDLEKQVFSLAATLMRQSQAYPELNARVRALNDQYIQGSITQDRYRRGLADVQEELHKLNPALHAAAKAAEEHKIHIKQSYAEGKAAIDEYTAHEQAKVQRLRDAYQQEEKDGKISAEANKARLLKLNQDSYDITAEGVRKQQALTAAQKDKKPMGPLEVHKELTAAKDKQMADDAKLEAEYAAKGVALDRALTETQIKDAEKAALAVQDLAVKNTNFLVSQKAMGAMEGIAAERAANEAVLKITQDSLVKQALLLRKNGEERKAQALGEEFIAAQRKYEEKSIELDNKASAEGIKSMVDMTKAGQTALDAEDDRQIESLETQRRVNEMKASAKLMTNREMEAAGRALDAQEDAIQARKLERDISILKQVAGAEQNHAAEIASMEARLAALRSKRSSKEQLQAVRDEIAGYKILGVVSVSVLQEEADRAQIAYDKLKAEGRGVYDLLAAYKKLLETQIDLARAQGKPTGNMEAALAGINVQLTMQDYSWKNLGGTIKKDMTGSIAGMWDKWAGGFAKAITDGKKFGDTMMNVLHQIENEILGKLIGGALKGLVTAFANVLAGGGAGGILAKIGGMLGGVAKGGAAGGAAGGAGTAAGNAPLTAAVGALDITTGTLDVTTGALDVTTGALGITMGVLDASIIALIATIDLNTAALYVSSIPGLQEGGTVLRTGVALVHAGETVASSKIMAGVGETLSAGSSSGGGHQIVSFDGATFHGVPDQRYVSSIMNNAVRQLRQSSRTWAFNPTGT